MDKPQGASNELWDKCLKRAVRYCAKYMVQAGSKPLNYEDAVKSVGKSLNYDLLEKKETK